MGDGRWAPRRGAAAACEPAYATVVALCEGFVGDAVGILMLMSNFMTVTAATPWGLHPVVGHSCNVAATRC